MYDTQIQLPTIKRPAPVSVALDIHRGDRVRIADKGLLWACPSMDREYTVSLIRMECDGVYAELDAKCPITGKTLSFRVNQVVKPELVKVA